jgi:hypothetical protein
MKQQVEVFFHSQQPYTSVQDEDLAQYPSGRLDFPNRYFNPMQAHQLYNQYHEQYAWADEVGVDGIMTNEHHASYWNMKPSANLDAAVLSKEARQNNLSISRINVLRSALCRTQRAMPWQQSLSS